RIWRAQIHDHKTPLADDVDFSVLAARYERSGGDIKNAVLKAALAAADEDVPDRRKVIRQEHFERAMEDVIGARSVLQQSLLADEESPDAVMARMETRQLEQQKAIESAFTAMRRPLTAAIALSSVAVLLALIALAVTLF
ncbi:MAG TPA: hypothetical protein VF021_05200, partial [Longimicrobiales bacterium]